jgi:hypothetical protein
LKRSNSKREESIRERNKLGFGDKLENEFDSSNILNHLLRFLRGKIEENVGIKTPQTTGRKGERLGRKRRGTAHPARLGLAGGWRRKMGPTCGSHMSVTRGGGGGRRRLGRLGPVRPREEEKSWAEIGPTT